MKLREKFRRFWAMDVHNHEGFTLVELIIVIAILAILSGVAVVGYSSYVEKANKQADMTLAVDVTNALMLRYYSEGDADSVAFVVIAPNGAVVTKYANDFGTAAMDAAFGAGWQEKMVLKYNDWKDNDLMAAGIAGGQDVLGSSFLASNTPGELLGEVTGVIGTTVDFLTSKGYVGEQLYNKMVENMDEATMLDACTKMGITVNYDDEGNAVSFGENVTDEQLANLMVFVASDEYVASVNGTNTNDPSSSAQIMWMYTLYMAAANSSYGSEKMLSDLDAALAGESVKDILNNLTTFGETYATELNAYQEDTSGIAETDGNAIVNMLTAVNSVSGKVTADDLKDANFFESGVVTAHMGTYLAAAELAAELGDIPEGAIVIFLYDGHVSSTCSELLG